MIRISGDLSLTETSQTRCSLGIRLEFCRKGRIATKPLEWCGCAKSQPSNSSGSLGRSASGHSRPDDPKPTAKGVVAINPVRRDFALDPQDLARLLVSRANAGDVEGVVALYEPDAALACGDVRIAIGTDAIRKFYTDLLATRRTFDLGEQRPAMLRENVTLTSTRLPNGIVTAEVARKQIDGTWLWAIDQPAISV